MITHAAAYRSTLGELDLGEDFKDIEIRNHACGDVLLKYCNYSAGLEPFCELVSPSHLKTVTHSVRLALAVNQ